MLKNKSSLYRFYRPSTFTEVAGHQNIVTILQNEIKNNAFPHALLFTGQKGTGKTSLARIFAKAINCEAPNGGNPCEKCSQCLLTNQGVASNIIEIDAASNNGVEEIRNIKENVPILPLSGTYKVYIVDEVHMLSKGAFNALLKTLEEPPKHVVFILATTEFAKLPATIISRCQTFNLQRIDQKNLINRLDYIANQEGFIIDYQVAQEIYFLSEGSLRDALNYLEQLMMISDNNLTLENLQKLFYLAPLSEKIQLINDLIDGDFNRIINYFEGAEAKGLDYHQFALSLMVILKEIIEYYLTDDESLLTYLDKENINQLNSNEVKKYFAIADCLTEAYQKTNVGGLNFNYLLISLLKLNQSSKQEILQPQKSKQISQLIDKTIDQVESFELKTIDDLKYKKAIIDSKFADAKIADDLSECAINTLVGNDGDIRKTISDKIASCFVFDNQNNLLNPNQASSMMAWYGSKITAVSDCEILVRFANDWEANYLHHCLQEPNYQNHLKAFFDKNFKIYPIAETQFVMVKKEYLFKTKNQSLPIHQHVQKQTKLMD